MFSDKEWRSFERKRKVCFKEALRKLRRMDFRGGTLEIECDCSFDATYIQHIRAKIVSVSWRNGKPYKIRFECPILFMDRGESETIVWEIPKANHWIREGMWNCQERSPRLLASIMAFQDMFEKAGGFGFREAQGIGIFLYPKGVQIPERPGFYQTPKERSEFMQMFGIQAEEALTS